MPSEGAFRSGSWAKLTVYGALGLAWPATFEAAAFGWVLAAVLGAKWDVKALNGTGVGSGESASVQLGTGAAGVEGSSHMVPTLRSEKAFLGVGTGAADAAGLSGRACPFVWLLAPAAGVEGACMGNAAPADSNATAHKKSSDKLHSLDMSCSCRHNSELAL